MNGKHYVGITSQPVDKRWMNGKGYVKCIRFWNAIQKYGWDNFDHRVLLNNLSEAEAKCLEKYMISMLNTQDDRFGYNITSGGDGANGTIISPESRMLMSIAKQGEKHPNYGKALSEDTRMKISKALVNNKNAAGSIRSEETKKKMSESKYKPVIMIDGVNRKRFTSAKEAEELTGISRKNISLCCKGYRKHAGGFAWKFE